MADLPHLNPQQSAGLKQLFVRWLEMLLNRANKHEAQRLKTGALAPTMASSEPEGGEWLFLGQWVKKNKYPALYAVVGNTYGSTSTTFKLPTQANLGLSGSGVNWQIKT